MNNHCIFTEKLKNIINEFLFKRNICLLLISAEMQQDQLINMNNEC